MSCYDVLLEEFNEEQELANATFASIAEAVDALYNFVAQDIQLEFNVALESAEDVEALKEAAEEAKKNVFVKLAAKLKEWAVKIVEQVKKIAMKAAIAAGNGGNAAMKKLISEKAKTKKAITLKKTEYGRSQTAKIVESLIELTRLDSAKGKADKVEQIFGAKDKFKAVEVDIAAGQSAKELYDKYVDQYIKGINYAEVSKCINGAAKDAQKVAKELEGDAAAEAKETAVRLMKAGSNLVTFAFQNLTVGVANAAKIALACGAVVKKEEKKEEA